MKIFSFAALAVAASAGSTVLLGDDVPCSDFAAVFGTISGMKTKCRGKTNLKKTKQKCNLICDNGQANVWSTKPIKVIWKKSLRSNQNCVEVLNYFLAGTLRTLSSCREK